MLSKLRFGLLLAVATISATLACNVLIGLDKFSEFPDSADGASDAADAGDAGDANVADAGHFDAGPSLASLWATGPMPNPAFDAGVDSSTLHTVSYSYAQNGDIQDSVTGLFWAKPAVVTDVQSAKAQCADSGSLYRVPTRIELVTTLDFTRDAGPYIDPLFQEAGVKINAVFLSSSPALDAQGQAKPDLYWAVDLGSGEVAPIDLKKTQVTLICVSGTWQ